MSHSSQINGLGIWPFAVECDLNADRVVKVLEQERQKCLTGILISLIQYVLCSGKQSWIRILCCSLSGLPGCRTAWRFLSPDALNLLFAILDRQRCCQKQKNQLFKGTLTTKHTSHDLPFGSQARRISSYLWRFSKTEFYPWILARCLLVVLRMVVKSS